MGFKEFAREDKAQVSAELIIVIAALIAVALVLIMSLQKTAQKGSKVIGEETERAWREISETSNHS